MTKYLELVDIFPDYIETDRFRIWKSTFTINEMILLQEQWHPKRFEKYCDTFTFGKEYIILTDKITNRTLMSSHEFELLTNQKFIDNAKGDVLIFGLGIGLIIFPLLTEQNINSITVIENDKNLIPEIEKILKEFDKESKLNIIHTDAFLFETEKIYDTIYFDIWGKLNKESFIEMDILSNKFNKNLKPGGWIDSWCSEEREYYES